MNNDIDIDQLARRLEDAIDGIAPKTLKGETVLATLPVWDSLALLIVLAMADTEYGVQLSGDEVKACKTVQDIGTLIAGKRR